MIAPKSAFSDYVTDFAAKRAEIAPDRTAFRDCASGRQANFAEIADAATRLATALHARGIEPGQRIGVICHNRMEFFALLFACQKCSALLAPLNWRQPAAELAPIVESAEIDLIFHDATFAGVAQELMRARGGACIDLDAEANAPDAWSALIAGEPDAAFAFVRRRAAEPWYLLFTSGTTGQPKAVIQTFAMALTNAVNISQAMNLATRERSVNFLPLFHTAGVNLVTLPLFLAGGMSHVMAKFDPDAILDLIGAGELTTFFGVPAIYQTFCLHPRFPRIDFTSVKSFGCGGAPLPEALIRQCAARGIRVQNGFGMTETGPTAFLVDADHAERKIGSVGKPQLLVEARIVDKDGTPIIGPGGGEIQMRGPGVTPGYFQNEEATRAAFADDGWLRTGDVARRDEEGFYFIIDRIKDMYISGGENVYPAEVERALVAHQAILEAAVVGVPDEKWGEVGHAFLLPRPGAAIDLQAVPGWCRERLAAYKIPKTFTIVEEFPRTAAGKIRKHLLRSGL